MTKRFILALIILSFFSSCHKNQNKKLGNISITKKRNLLGAIDLNGKKILDIKYSDIDTLSNQYLKASINSYYGVYDLNGKEIIPTIATDVLKVFDSKYFLLQIGKYQALFDFDGNKIIDEHDEFYSYSDGIIIARKKIIIDHIDLENRYFVYDLENPNSKLNKSTGYKNFIELLNPLDNRNNYLFKTNRNYVFDMNNKQLKQFSNYYKVGKFGENLLIVNNTNHLSGYADTKGKLKFDFVFVNAEPFKNGKASVSIDGNQDFIINKNGTCISNCPSEKLLKYKNIKNWIIPKSSQKN